MLMPLPLPGLGRLEAQAGRPNPPGLWQPAVTRLRSIPLAWVA